MIKKHIHIIVTILVLLNCNLVKAQFDNNWCFGWHAGIDFSDPNLMVFESSVCMDSFNKSEPAVYVSSSMSDCQGKLLFYSAGPQVWNKKHQLMPHGYLNTNIISAYQYSLGMILPKPLSDSEYYVVMGEPNGGNHLMKYSVVNINRDNGLGDVDTTQMNISFFNKGVYNITYVNHANDTDLWLLCSPDSNTYAFKVTNSGISTSPIKTSYNTYLASFGNVAKTSHDGKNIILGSRSRLSYATSMGIFDNKLGKMIGQKPLFPIIANTTYFDVEFSPNDSIIYYYNAQTIYNTGGNYKINKIYQINRHAVNPATTILLIDSSVSDYIYNGMQITPDNRIFLGTSGDSLITIINNPDNWGKACNLQKRVLNISPGRWGINPPNNYAAIRKLRFVTQLDSTGCSLDSVWFGNVSDTNYKSFKWYFGDGDSSSLPNPVHYYSNPGKYRVLLTGYLNTCSYKQFYSDSVYINHRPNISFKNTNSIYTCGNNQLHSTFSWKYADTLQIHWGDNTDTILYSANKSGLDSIILYHNYQTGNYIVSAHAWNSACEDSIAFSNSVNIDPKITPSFKPDYLTSCGNSTITLTDSSSGMDSIIQQRKWIIYYPNNTIKQYDTVSSNKLKLIVQDTGYYNAKLIYITKQGCIDSLYKTKVFRILPQPVVYIDSPAHNPLCFGDSFILTAQQRDTAYPPLVSFKWNMGQVATKSIKVDTANSYYVAAVNSFGCGAQSNTVKISFLPQLFANIKKAADSLYVVTTRKIVSYTWYKDSIYYNTTSALYHPPSGRYYVQVMDANGCEASSGSLLYTTGIGYINEAENGIRVFPNPASDILYIEGMPSGKTTIVMYDMLGRRVYSASTKGETTWSLNLKNLQNTPLPGTAQHTPSQEGIVKLYILWVGEQKVKVLVE